MSSSGSLIREARLRAGLSQGDLGQRTGKDRAQIARWERDDVSPPYETLRSLVRACGFDLSTELVVHGPPPGPVASARRPTGDGGGVLPRSPRGRLHRMLARRRGGAA